MMYDVIVVGAGPAGSTASKVLAENGYKVLIMVEKFKMPRYKSCSGQLIKKSIDLVQLYYGEEVPVQVMCIPYENKGMVFTDDKGKEYRFEQPGLNVWRSSFDKWLADKAKEAGTDVRDETMAVSCEEKEGVVSVVLKEEDSYTVQAKYVIDCEGVVGSLKKQLIKADSQYIITYQTYNVGSINLDYHYFYAYLQPELSEYDAWFNVKDNQLVLGVSVKDNSNVDLYYSRFIDYMKRVHGLNISEQLKKDRWLMPRIKPRCELAYGVGRVFFAGEIAGFLNPMGEGISAAMESGHCIAEAITRFFDDTDKIYTDYKLGVEGLHGYMKRQWSLVAGMADTFKEMW